MKKFLAIVLTFVLCFGVLSLAFAAEDEATATVPDGYTGIYSAEDLDGIRSNLSGKYILMNDIDLSAYENWNPIGTSEEPFTGELDGNNYIIKNLKINNEFDKAETFYWGLFGDTSDAVFSDILIKDIDVKVKQAGSNAVKLTFGGVAGVASNSTISGCAVSGNINAENFSTLRICGVVGLSYFCEFYNCANYADIGVKINKAASSLKVGGVAAYLRYTPLTESCNYGDITVSGTEVINNRDFKIGGVYGDAMDNFKNTTHDGNNYNKGTVSVDFSTDRTFIGGIAGESYSIVSSYNAGEINYPKDFAGFAGALAGNAFECNLAINMPQRLTNLYYLNEGMTDFSYGEQPYVDREEDIFENIKYLTPEEMRKQESFVGFDFENIWEMEENGYPVLKNTPVIPEDEEDENSTTEITTEPTTESTTVTVTEPSTVETTTEKPTETSTEPSTDKETTTQPSTELKTETSTEPETDPNGLNNETCWLVRIIKKIIGFFMWLFSLLGC